MSERALRPSVIFHKVTNGFRCECGAGTYAAFRSVVSTPQANGASVLDTVQSVTSAERQGGNLPGQGEQLTLVPVASATVFITGQSNKMKRLTTAALFAVLLTAQGASALAQNMPTSSGLPVDASGLSVRVPGPWSPQLHQNFGGLASGHGYWPLDQNINATADFINFTSSDASVLWQFVVTPGSAGNQVGLQITLNGTTYDMYTTITAGETPTQAASALAATVNGGIVSATVAYAGTNAVNGATYALDVPNIPSPGATCISRPQVVAATDGSGHLVSVVPAVPSNNIVGGICFAPLPAAVPLLGTDATLNPTQGNYLFVAADMALTDQHGFGYQPTGGLSGSTLLFDLPYRSGVSVAGCAATTTGIPVGTSCPTPGTGSSIALHAPLAYDNGPVFNMLRTNPGMNPPPGSSINRFGFIGDLSAAANGAATYGGVFVRTGYITSTGAQTTEASGTTIAVTSSANIYNGLLIWDITNPESISPGTTVTISGTTLTLVGGSIVGGGVFAGDTLEFTDPNVAVGDLILGAANAGSANNFAGTEFLVCGSPGACRGYDAYLSLAKQGATFFGINNGYTGGSVTSGLQLSTGTGDSFINFTLSDGNGSPTYATTTGQSVANNANVMSLLGASATATLFGSSVASLSKTASGSHYTNGTFPLVFSGGGGTGAAGTYTVTGGAVSSVNLISGGSGYSSAPAVNLPNGLFQWYYSANSADPWLTIGVNGSYLGTGTQAFGGSSPAVNACGTSPSIDAHATNNSGTITVGTGATALCAVTFANNGFLNWNHCRVTPQTPLSTFGYSYTKTTLTVTATSLSGEVFDYDCDGQ